LDAFQVIYGIAILKIANKSVITNSPNPPKLINSEKRLIVTIIKITPDVIEVAL